jgi:hypothetical protein
MCHLLSTSWKTTHGSMQYLSTMSLVPLLFNLVWSLSSWAISAKGINESNLTCLEHSWGTVACPIHQRNVAGSVLRRVLLISVNPTYYLATSLQDCSICFTALKSVPESICFTAKTVALRLANPPNWIKRSFHAAMPSLRATIRDRLGLTKKNEEFTPSRVLA